MKMIKKNKMIDLHTHVLPGIDDGAKDVSESIKMLEEAYEQGVSICALTPHAIIHSEEDISAFLNKRQKAYELLQKNIFTHSGGLPKMLLGAEIYLDNDISQYNNIDKLCIGDSRAILVELPLKSKLNPNADEWIYKLVRRKLKPIIAHIDRYPFFTELHSELSEIPVVYQLNASMFKSTHGRHFIKKALQTKKTLIVSSDMHNTAKRPCNLKKAYLKSSKFYENTETLFFLNAKRILDIS